MSEVVIEANNLSKTYGQIQAVSGINLSIKEGEVYGFLGPNGSGKSTTILMMLGYTEPTGGSIRVWGKDPARDPIAVKRIVGYLPETVGFYGDLTGLENLLFTAELNGINPEEAHRRSLDLLDMVELLNSKDQPVSQYSRGMKQRLGIADVLIKDPKIVILDDPTLGLDPAGIQWLLELIERLSRQLKITIFLSSHQLHEVQRICNRVGIMSYGQLVLEGKVTELVNPTDDSEYEISVETESAAPSLRQQIRAMPHVKNVTGKGKHMLVKSVIDVRADIAQAVVSSGSRLLELQAQGNSLQEIYLKYFQEAST
ncbi:MAG: ABC transporter ATP-binding protein [Chloroflexi bacterium]|nr:ABC transporter ATP-binding protein [Chloroflexota bacterium]|tara:strand:+ start:2448 stop:3386 length:939 start_codon:yes stop_codon:yes gene_type:complete